MKRNNELECIEAFDHITPATVLQSVIDGVVVRETEVPERCTRYTRGQIVRFSSKVHMRGFMKAHPGKFREVQP